MNLRLLIAALLVSLLACKPDTPIPVPPVPPTPVACEAPASWFPTTTQPDNFKAVINCDFHQ